MAVVQDLLERWLRGWSLAPVAAATASLNG
jgi:hypothetical protein